MLKLQQDHHHEIGIGAGETKIGDRHLRDTWRSFGQRCSRLVKEQRARFYIFRRCVTILVCWHDCADS